MGVDHQVHRSGALKQTNKGHKTGRHRSKGAIDNEQKGMNRHMDKQKSWKAIEIDEILFVLQAKCR